ncbi:NAD(P)-binding protein [Amniculicola lignicola CBS 123094]|uniref:Probable quinone oxidoreductase n=1 Tax=Amniculicola lignicola CBS 123094 TaxID=1392246 RepID=A0A6A5VWQ8_9PLEO|nr:NAD(P)-binding protein [Amniculicola lignicola CBS 123094]
MLCFARFGLSRWNTKTFGAGTPGTRRFLGFRAIQESGRFGDRLGGKRQEGLKPYLGRADTVLRKKLRLGFEARDITRKMSTSIEVPKTMKAVQIDKNGGVEVLQYKDVPVPELKEGQVLVKNEFIGINYIDTYFRAGLYPLPHTPYILGREGSGTVVSRHASAPADLQPGTRVVYMGEHAYAEYTPASAKYTIPIPSSVDAKVAAASTLQALTALTLIREAHKVEKGDWVLVTAAAGGVGLWLCQLLRAVGARTIATASTQEKRKLAEENGAEVTVEYHEEDREAFTRKVVEITGGEGVAAVFDSVGKVTFDACLACVRRKGSMVSFGNASGAVTGFALGRLAAKNVKLVRPTLFNYIFTREEFKGYADELWSFITNDKLNVQIHDVYPLKDIVRATQDIEGRKTTGKLLLRP